MGTKQEYERWCEANSQNSLKSILPYQVDKDYWEKLMIYSDYILEDIAYNLDKEVAKKLGLSVTRFAYIKPVLLAAYKMKKECCNARDD